jgi:hypothetical protein
MALLVLVLVYLRDGRVLERGDEELAEIRADGSDLLAQQDVVVGNLFDQFCIALRKFFINLMFLLNHLILILDPLINQQVRILFFMHPRLPKPLAHPRVIVLLPLISFLHQGHVMPAFTVAEVHNEAAQLVLYWLCLFFFKIIL